MGAYRKPFGNKNKYVKTEIIENTKHWGCKKEIVVYGSNSFYDSCLGKKKVVYSLIYFSRG